MNFKKSFLKYCKDNRLEINKNQIEVVDYLNKYYSTNFGINFLKKLFKKKNYKLGFYLVGDVGVGKTMILNFFFNELKEKKLRLHFNEFMIEFHNFIFQSNEKENGIIKFVKNLKKRAKILYFDEFQVTNIVDAMILGKLFRIIFQENMRVIFTSNVKINDLYKEGLQREQFLPFIRILHEKSYELELLINEDYRTNNTYDRFLSPLDQSTNFKVNKFFRQLTKDKSKNSKILEIKGRKLKLEDFHEGVLRFDFKEFFDQNLGSEDYIQIATNCNFIFIENLPNFNYSNSNQQSRFITFIDIIYEKKIPMMISSEKDLSSLESSDNLNNQFRRTVSRLYELTSLNYF